MLRPELTLALYMEGALGETFGKMGHGILRYSANPIACIIDSTKVGRTPCDVTGINRACPIVSTVAEAMALGAQVLVLGIAPPGGAIPAPWWNPIDQAVAGGLSIVNGLHDQVGPRYPNLPAGQFIWDVRVEPPGLGVATGRAGQLPSRRVLMVGTDMAIGKMTTGLEIYREARRRDIRAAFAATGQIGITIMGSGVPLDAVRLDYAGGAVEAEVLKCADADLIIVEGQGSLIHPASSANLPLLRGAMPTHLVLCHRLGMQTLQRLPHIAIPPLRRYADLYEELSTAAGVFPRARLAAGALNTSGASEEEAREGIRAYSEELGVPADDPIRFGAARLLDAILSAPD